MGIASSYLTGTAVSLWPGQAAPAASVLSAGLEASRGDPDPVVIAGTLGALSLCPCSYRLASGWRASSDALFSPHDNSHSNLGTS